MHSVENLRGIPNELNRTLHQGDIRKAWNAFFKENPKASKQELLDFATEIDRRYGHLFLPPIRGRQ
jgi:hypothetical protein